MGAVVFLDVDTQVDFIEPGAALYVSGAETIVDNLRALTDHARRMGLRIVASVDYHEPTNAELSSTPDFRETFPPHCLRGTRGQEKIEATAPRNPLWIDSDPIGTDELVAAIHAHDGELIFRKQKFDVFSNPNVDTVLESIDPTQIVLYGVALDVCDAYAIEGLLDRGRKVRLVTDAVRAIDEERGRKLVEDWRDRGVALATTDEIISERFEP